MGRRAEGRWEQQVPLSRGWLKGRCIENKDEVGMERVIATCAIKGVIRVWRQGETEGRMQEVITRCLFKGVIKAMMKGMGG